MGAVATLGHSATSPRANRVPKVPLVVGRLTRREPPFELEKCEMETKEQRQSGKTCASSPPFDDGDSLSVPGMKLCDLGHPLRLGSGVRDGSVGRDGGDGRGARVGWMVLARVLSFPLAFNPSSPAWRKLAGSELLRRLRQDRCCMILYGLRMFNRDRSNQSQ